jgi:hypothetical protein
VNRWSAGGGVSTLLVVDLVVHGWDLATATGRPFEVPAALRAATAEFLDQMAETGRRMARPPRTMRASWRSCWR